MSNSKILEIYGTEYVLDYVKRMQANYLGHIARQKNTIIVKRLLLKNKKRSRPIKTLEDHVLEGKSADNFCRGLWRKERRIWLALAVTIRCQHLRSRAKDKVKVSTDAFESVRKSFIWVGKLCNYDVIICIIKPNFVLNKVEVSANFEYQYLLNKAMIMILVSMESCD